MSKADQAIADQWRGFYEMNRSSVAALFEEFGLYGRAPPTLDANMALRREGQRDVLLRIVQLIGLKQSAAPTDAWDDHDILDRMMKR